MAIRRMTLLANTNKNVSVISWDNWLGFFFFSHLSFDAFTDFEELATTQSENPSIEAIAGIT